MLGLPGTDNNSGSSARPPQLGNTPAGLAGQQPAGDSGSRGSGSNGEGGRVQGQPVVGPPGGLQHQQQASERGGGGITGGQLPDIGCTEELLLQGRDAALVPGSVPESTSWPEGINRHNLGNNSGTATAGAGYGGDEPGSSDNGSTIPGAGSTVWHPSRTSVLQETDIQLVRRTTSADPTGVPSASMQAPSNRTASAFGQHSRAASQGELSNKRRRPGSL
jgi:hypothetical protein